MRTGRTNDFDRRRMEHRRDPTLGKYDFDRVRPTNSYPEQRGATNYVAAGDPVSMFAMYCCGLQEDPYFDDILHHTHYVGSMTDPLTAHSFSGPGYREALEQIFSEKG